MIYAVSVSGPKMYQLDDLHMKLMAQTYEKKQFFQTIEVAPDCLRYFAYSIDGAVADSFELRKQVAVTTYVNQAPGKRADAGSTNGTQQ